jgi:Domain of unknown function (DUF3846)
MKQTLKMMLVIKPDGSQQRISFTGREPALETLQEHVGGYIEMVPQGFKLDGKSAVMYVNEDGLRLKLPVNADATRLCGGFHTIVGTAVIVPRGR